MLVAFLIVLQTSIAVIAGIAIVSNVNRDARKL